MSQRNVKAPLIWVTILLLCGCAAPPSQSIAVPTMGPLDRSDGPAITFGAFVDEDHGDVFVVVAGSSDCNASPRSLEAGDPAVLTLELLGAGQEYCLQDAVETTYRVPMPAGVHLIPGDHLRVADYGDVVLQAMAPDE